MPDGPSFEATAGEITALLGAGGIEATLIGTPEIRVRSVAPIDSASAHDLAFVRDERFLQRWPVSDAGVALVSAPLMETDHAAPLHEASDRAVIVVPDADLALIALLGYVKSSMPSGDPERGVHPTAIVDPSATLGEGVAIGPYACIGAGATIGDRAVIRCHAIVGVGARVGDEAVLRERVVLGDRCTIGARTVLHTGVIVGTDGFGYRPPSPETGQGHYPIKIPHIGTVIIGDDVEVGANTCIDRATHSATRIGDGTKIDNLCQIGHNVTVGRGVIMCGTSGIGGSTVVHDGAMIGGQVGIVDNLVLGEGCRITAASGVMRNIPAGETVSGTPARPVQRHLRKQAALEWLADAIGPLRDMLRREGHDG